MIQQSTCQEKIIPLTGLLLKTLKSPCHFYEFIALVPIQIIGSTTGLLAKLAPTFAIKLLGFGDSVRPKRLKQESLERESIV